MAFLSQSHKKNPEIYYASNCASG